MKIFANITLFATLSILMIACGGSNNSDTAVDETAADDTLATGNYMVDSERTNVEWNGSMLAIGGVSLYSHHGKIGVTKGEIIMDNGNITGGTVVVDMTSISPEDENFGEDEGSRESDLISHLQSDDFFAVDTFPTSTFDVTGYEDGKIKGNLTVRGITKPQEIEDVNITETPEGVKITGKLVFDRQEYNVRFSMNAQDKILSDDITLDFDILATETASM